MFYLTKAVVKSSIWNVWGSICNRVCPAASLGLCRRPFASSDDRHEALIVLCVAVIMLLLIFKVLCLSSQWNHCCCCCCYYLCCCWLLKALCGAVFSTDTLWLWLESIEECSCERRKGQERPYPKSQTRSVGDTWWSCNCQTAVWTRGQTMSLHAILDASVIGTRLSCNLVGRVLL